MKTTTPATTKHSAALTLLLLASAGLVACTTPGARTATPAASAIEVQSGQKKTLLLQSEPATTAEVAAHAETGQQVQPVLLRDVQTQVSIPAGASSELLGEQGVAALEQLLVELSAWSSIERIAITGHTDSEGSDVSNERFSLQRATAVAEQLKALGIDPEAEFVIAGEGEQNPVADNSSIAGRALNRRVEIVVEGKIDVLPETLPTADLQQAAIQ